MPTFSGSLASGSALVTNTQIKDFLGISASTWDTLLTTLSSRAQAMVDRYCNRTLGSASYTEDISGMGMPYLIVRHTPITTLTSVSSLDRDTAGTETATAISVGSYRYDAETGCISLINSRGIWRDDDGYYAAAPRSVLSPRFEPGFKNYRVVYTAGYTTGTVPADITDAIIQIAAELFKMRQINPGMAAEAIGGPSYSAKTEAEMMERHMRLLAPFRRVSL